MANPTTVQQDKGRAVYDALTNDPKYNKFIPETFEGFNEAMQDPTKSKAVHGALSRDPKYNRFIPNEEGFAGIFAPKFESTQLFAPPEPSLGPLTDERLAEIETVETQTEAPIVAVDEQPADDDPIDTIRQEIETNILEEQQQIVDDITEEIQAEVDAGNLSVIEANTRLQNRIEVAQEDLFTKADTEFDTRTKELNRQQISEQLRSSVEEGQQVQPDKSRISQDRILTPRELTQNREQVQKNEERRQTFNQIANEQLEKIPKPPVQPMFAGQSAGDPNVIVRNRTPEETVNAFTRGIYEKMATMTSEESAGFFSGLGDQGIKLIPFIGILSEIPQLIREHDVLNKPENERTQAEQQLAEAIATMNTFERSGLKPTTYEWGEMVGQMIPFLGEFAATGGVATAAARKVGKELIKHNVKKGLVNYAIRGTSAAIAQATANPQRYVSETIRRMTPVDNAIINLDEKKVDELLRVREGEGFTEAAVKGYLTQVAEMWTERLGISYGAGAARFMKSKVGKLLVNPVNLKRYTLSQIAKRKGITTISGLQKFKQRVGLQGVVTEIWGEELPNMALNDVITGDNGRRILEDLNPLSPDLLKMVVPMLILQGGIGAPSGVVSGLKGVSKLFVTPKTEGKKPAVKPPTIPETIGERKVTEPKVVKEEKKVPEKKPKQQLTIDETNEIHKQAQRDNPDKIVVSVNAHTGKPTIITHEEKITVNKKEIKDIQNKMDDMSIPLLDQAESDIRRLESEITKSEKFIKDNKKVSEKKIVKKTLPAPVIITNPTALKNRLSNVITKQNKIGEILATAKSEGHLTLKGKPKETAPENIKKLAEQSQENKAEIIQLRLQLEISKKKAVAPIEVTLTQAQELENKQTEIRQLEAILNTPGSKELRQKIGKKADIKKTADVVSRVAQLKEEVTKLKSSVGETKEILSEVSAVSKGAVVTKKGKSKQISPLQTEQRYNFEAEGLKGEITQVNTRTEGVQDIFFATTTDGSNLSTNGHNTVEEAMRELIDLKPKRINVTEKGQVVSVGDKATASQQKAIDKIKEDVDVTFVKLFPKDPETGARQVKLGVEGGDIITLKITARGKIETDSKILQEYYPELAKSLKKPETKKALATAAQESTVKGFQEPSKTNPIIQRGNKKGRAGSTPQRQSTTDNLDGQELFQKNHPIQAVGLNGLQQPNSGKISQLLKQMQGGRKIFGKITITRSPSKRRRGSLGNYTPSTGRVAVKNIRDVPTMLHEIGHALDDRFDLLGALLEPKSPGEQKAAAEILSLARFGSKPPAELAPDAAHEYIMGEGIAEFFKSMVFNPDATLEQFPNASQYIMEQRLPEGARNHFKEFSKELRNWVGTNAKNKIASNISDIKRLSVFTRWRDRWFNNPEFYLVNADNWQNEAMEAFQNFEPLKAIGKLARPVTSALMNNSVGFRRKFATQFLTKAFAFEQSINYVNNIRGEQPLHEDDPRILARLMYGMHEKYDDLLETGLVTAANNKLVLDKGEALNINYLLAPFDKTSAESIQEGMMGSVQLMIAQRIIERFKLNVSKDIAPLRSERQVLKVNRDLLNKAQISDPKDTGKFKILHGITNRGIKKLLSKTGTKEEMRSIINGVAAALDADLSVNLKNLRKKLKISQTIRGEKIVAGIGAGIFRDLDVAVEFMDDYRASKQSNPEFFDMITDGARRYRKYADTLLVYMVDKGRINVEQYDQIKAQNEFYVAMQRVQQVDIGDDIKIYKTTSVGKTGIDTNPIKTFKGSGKEIVNPYASLIENTYTMIKESDRNDVMRAFTDLLSTDRPMRKGQVRDFTDIAVEVGEGGKNTIRVYKKGEAKYFRVHEDLFRYLNGVGQAVYRLPQILTFMPRLLRMTVTTSPPFLVKNRLRDFQSRLMLSKSSSITELPAEFWSKKQRDETKSMLNIYGGGQSGMLRDPSAYTRYETSYYGLMDQAIQKASKAGFKIIDLVNFQKMWQNYKKILDRGERATRLQEFKSVFKQAKKEGLDDHNASLIAAFEARDLLDFSVAGETMAVINQLLPFTNAAVQGLRRAARTIQNNPDNFAKRMFLYSVIPAVAIRMMMKYQDDDTEKEYLQLPSYQKDMFYNFKIGGQWIGIPKPFELGLAASWAERLATFSMYDGTDQQEEADRAFEGFEGQVGRAMAPFDETSITSLGGLGAITEAVANYDFFRKKHVISPFENSENLGLRNTESASAVSKVIAEAMGGLPVVDTPDPRKIDFVIRSTTSYYGSAVTAITKRGGDKSLYPEDLSIGTIGSIAKALSGLAKTDPVFAARDVQWTLTNAHAFNLREPGILLLEDVLSLYWKQKTPEAKKTFAKIARSLGSVMRNLIQKGQLRERKLVEAHIKKLAKGVKPDTEMSKLFDKFIKK